MSKGDYLLRLGPEKLAEVAKAAEAEGLPVSEWLRQAVEARLAGGNIPRPVTREEVIREMSGVLAMMRQGFVLVPAAEVPAGPWDKMMTREDAP